MIFGKGYDEVLWLTLYSDRKNRNLIVDFVNSIPDSLYEKIHCSTDKVNKYSEDNVPFGSRESKGLSDSLVTSDGLLYWYRIDPYSFCMTFGYSVFTDKGYDEAFEISLYPYDQDEINFYERKLMAIVRDMSEIGSFCNTRDDEIKHIMLKTKLGFVMCCSSDKKTTYKLVNIDKIPSEICLSDMKNPMSVNRLVRLKNNRRSIK